MERALLSLFGLLVFLQVAQCLGAHSNLKQAFEDERFSVGRDLLARRNREGRRTHNANEGNSILAAKQNPGHFVWDGQPFWEWDNKRTLYFEPIAGLGNRLRALASALTIAKEAGVGMKVIWREEVACGEHCGHMPAFNSTWPDLFAYPKLRLAPNFPGSNYSVHYEHIWLEEDVHIKHPGMDPVVPGFNCTVWVGANYSHVQWLLQNKWTHVNGEEVLCLKSDLWLTKNGELDGKWFFKLLEPSPPVQKMIDDYKSSVAWDDHNVLGAHIRRTDLAITQPDGTKKRMDSLLSLAKYVDPVRKLINLVPPLYRDQIRYFVATDDGDAEKIMKTSFQDGFVLTYPKTNWQRDSVEGIQQALVEVMLLSQCPILLGTYYSSFSEMAKLIGWPYYIQIGSDLHQISQETKFEGRT